MMRPEIRYFQHLQRRPDGVDLTHILRKLLGIHVRPKHGSRLGRPTLLVNPREMRMQWSDGLVCFRKGRSGGMFGSISCACFSSFIVPFLSNNFFTSSDKLHKNEYMYGSHLAHTMGRSYIIGECIPEPRPPGAVHGPQSKDVGVRSWLAYLLGARSSRRGRLSKER